MVFFYGGSWSSGERADYAFVGEAIAAQGFVAVVPDYRLYPQVRFPAFLEDGAAAVRWVVDGIEAYGGDPDRIALAGHSAGAYNTMMLALDRRFLDAAGVDGGRLGAVAGLAGPYDFLPFDSDVTRRTFADWPEPGETQPIHWASGDAPPTFLATGADDGTVEARNTRALAAELAKAGSEVETAIYPDVGHAGLLLALASPFRDRAPVLEDMSAFFRARLGP